MTVTLAGSPTPLQDTFDAALLDLDGVTYRGPEGIPSAAPALETARAAGMTIVFVTNNASREPQEVARHLSELGIRASSEEILTSAQVAASMLASRLTLGDRVLVVGGQALKTEVEAKGLVVVESAADNPVAVVQGWHPDVGWRHLAEAAYAVRAGAFFLATNRDSTLPNEWGIAPGNGALVGAVVTAAEVEPESAGKPDPRMFLEAATRASAQKPLVVGDRLDTDIAGARAAGIPALLVLTGISTARDAILAHPHERPTFIGRTLACLAEPHPIPEARDGFWHVGTASARVDRGNLRVTGQDDLDTVRAACVAAWEAADKCEAIHVESLSRFEIK